MAHRSGLESPIVEFSNKVTVVPVFQDRNEDVAKTALFTAGFILLLIMAAAFLASCAKVEAIDQNENAPILVDEPISMPADEPVITTNDDAFNTATKEATDQVEAGNRTH